MSSPEEWCREQIANLQIKDLQRDTLSEIKNHLTKLPADEAITTSNFLQMPAIFDCLETAESEQTNLACDVLSICMTNLNLGESVNTHSSLLEKSLNHPNPNVKLLGLNELLRIAEHNVTLISNTNLIIAVIRAITCPETSVGSACVSLLSKVLPNFIEIGVIKNELEKIMVNNQDVVKCRIFELGINLARKASSTENVNFILTKMIDDFKESKDILLQLNILELTADLAVMEPGLIYLENKGLFAALIKMIDTPDDHLLMMPGLIKFFGSVASMHPSKIFNKYPSIISSLLDCIIANDSSNLPTALDTLGHLGRITDGKLFLNEISGNKMGNVLKEIANSIGYHPTELKIRTLNCLELLFQSETPENNQIASLTQTWYGFLSSNTNDLSFVMPFVKNSFPDIKIAGLKLLQSILIFKWGETYLNQTAGLFEYLLDRKAEFDINVMHEKFSIIKMLSERNTTSFDRDTVNHLKKYVMEGVFYKETITEVAIEGGE